MGILTPAEYRALLRQDFCSFVQRCFYELNPRTAFLWNWHIEVLAAKLADCFRHTIRRLIITIPPRRLKSLCASIALPAWWLGHDPAAQILCISYGQELADKHARDCRAVMTSAFYQRLFPTHLSPQKQSVQEFVTTRQGFRFATSVGGVLTGRGGDIVIIDDPLKPDEALSDTQRRAVNEWYDHTLVSRLNDKRAGCIILIMQRLHQDDLVGHVLEQEPWEVISFPAVAERDESHAIKTPLGAVRFDRRRTSFCILPESLRQRLISSAAPSGNTISPVSTSRRRRRWAAACSRRPGSNATTVPNRRKNSTRSCKAGIPPTSQRSLPIIRSARLGT
jgi:hypothetical protein